MDPTTLLTEDQIADAGLEGWRVDGNALVATFATRNFATGLQLVDRVGAEAETADHHPDITLTYPSVTVLWTSHDSGGITQRDIDLARRTTELATELGIAASDRT